MRRGVAGLVAAMLTSVPLGAALLTASPAHAWHEHVRDPRDTRGPLDVRVIQTFGRERPLWRVITFRRWTAARIWDRGFMVVRLNTRGDHRPNRYILVTSDGRRLHGSLWQVHRGGDRMLGTVTVWRPNRRSVSMRVPLARLNIGPARTFFAWWAHTLWMGQGCPRVCIDRIPNRGRIREPLPREEPEPEPTSTQSNEEPSPEPSP